MDITYPGFRVQADGAILAEDGLGAFPSQGIWSADDRLLIFCSQQGGGVSSLVFQGKQPQSANAFLLHNPEGALFLSLDVQAGAEAFTLPHRFQEVLVRPYGWENTFSGRGLEIHTQTCLHDNCLTWQVQCRNLTDKPVRLEPILRLDPQAMTVRVNGTRVWQPIESEAGGLRLTARDQLQTRTWIDVPGFKDTFIDAHTCILVAGENPTDAVEGCAVRLSPETIPPHAWGRERRFFVVCRPEAAAAYDHLAGLRADPGAPFEAQRLRYAARAAMHPVLRVRDYPVAEALFRLAPLYAEACKVHGAGGLRSSAGGHYFVWGWDNLMAGHELAHWGDVPAAEALLDFIVAHPAEDGCVPHRFDNDLQPLQVTGFDFISQLFISLLYQHYSETLDPALLQRHYPFARRIFAALAARSDERGFYHTLGMYPDAPEKLDRTADSLVGYENGFWYCACRMMEVLAQAAGEPEVAAQAAGLAARLEATYLEAFFDRREGFLVDALVGKSFAPNGTYPRYGLFPLHNAFGAWLLRPAQAALSAFIKRELVKPDGIRMVPTWDQHIGTETVTSDCWFLHFDLYCLKAFRRAGDAGAIEQWLKLVERYYRTRRVIPELQILAAEGERTEGWPGIVGQIWQLFAMSGWVRGFLEGVLGIETDIGGLTYIPCPLSQEMTLQGFPFRGGVWDVTVAGSGGWVRSLSVDGKPVSGVYKVPEEHYTPQAHHLHIERGEQPPAAPCIREAVGASIRAPRLVGNQLTGYRLEVELRAWNQVDVIFYSGSAPTLLVDGLPTPCEWDAHSGAGCVTLAVNGSARVALQATPTTPGAI